MSLQLVGAGAGAAIGLYNSYQQRKKQAAFIKQQRKILVQNFNNDISSLKKSFQLQKENAAYQIFQNEIDEKKQIADTTINASSSGIGGISVVEAIQNIKLASDFKESRIERNVENLAENMDAQAFNLYSKLKADRLALKQGQTNLLDVLAGGIGGATAGLSAANTAESILKEFD